MARARRRAQRDCPSNPPTNNIYFNSSPKGLNSAVEMAIEASSTAEAEGILRRLWKTWGF